MYGEDTQEKTTESQKDNSIELKVLKQMHKISTCVMRQEGMREIFSRIVETAMYIMQADRGIVQLLDEHSGVLRIIAYRGFDQPSLNFFNSIHESQAACTAALERREHIIIEDITQNSFMEPQSLEIMLATGVRAVQSLPLFSHTGHLLGMLSTYHRTPHQPDKRALELVDLVVQQAVDILKRMQAEQAVRNNEERHRALAGELLKEIEGRKLFSELIGLQDIKKALSAAITSIRNITKCQAIAMRLEDKGDYPYFVWEGFADEFILQEKSLCAKDQTNNRIMCENGQYLLECMCGNVIRGRTDPLMPFFSSGGSFWCNSTSKLAAKATQEDLKGKMRGHCCDYESVALVPLKIKENIIGLIQINDKRSNLFSQEMISYLEMLGERIGTAVSHWWVHQKSENIIGELHTENLIRIKAQKKAATAYDQINQMLQRITDGFFAVDNEWCYTYINSVAESFWSCNAQDMLGKKIWDCFTNVQPFYDEYHKAKKENVAVHFEAKSVSTDAWLEVHAYPSPEGLSIYFRNITEHKAIEQSKHDYQRLLEEQILLLNLDPDYTFIHDLDGKINFWGQGAAQGYGWTENEALSKISHALLKTQFPIPVTKINEEVLAKGKWVGELVHTTKDNKKLIVKSYWLLRKQGKADSKEIIEINKDITEEKKIREELDQLETMKLVSQIAAGISHEIRNPMTTVRGYLQLLAKKKNYSEEKPKFELMIEELDRANQIITEFLSLAKNKAAPLVAHNLNEVIRTLTPLLEADAASQSKSFRTHLYPNIPEVLLNTNEIRQLILNFVRNGFEATGVNGKVSILTYFEDDHVVLAIEDNGCGIPADIVKNLGTPFLSTKSSGTGLGITTCYNIARRHNAMIEVNTAEGVTIFYIKFPAITTI
jgi:signal transduction histidine kinase/GAF domain-containing protein